MPKTVKKQLRTKHVDKKTVVFKVYNGDTYTVPSEMIERLEAHYVDIDVCENLKNMAGWLRHRPSARPMGPLVEKFARRWLDKATDWRLNAKESAPMMAPAEVEQDCPPIADGGEKRIEGRPPQEDVSSIAADATQRCLF